MRIFLIPAKYTESRLCALKTSVGSENLIFIYIEQCYWCSLLFKRLLFSPVWLNLTFKFTDSETRWDKMLVLCHVSMKRHLKLSRLLSVSAAPEGQRALAHTMHVHPSFLPPDVTAASDEHNSPCAPHAFGVLHAGLKHPCDVTLNTAACFVWGCFGCIPSEWINWRVSDRFIHSPVSAEHILPACAFFVK